MMTCSAGPKHTIDVAGNFGWDPELFADSDRANAEIDFYIDKVIPQHRSNPNSSALCAMVTPDDPIKMSQIKSNIKIAIGGRLNEPRDVLLTILYGKLTDPEQRAHVVQREAWGDAFDEGVRWVAPDSGQFAPCDARHRDQGHRSSER